MNKYEEQWIRYATMDLEVAKRELFRNDVSEEDILTPIICFHCQQAVEKALKAYLIKNRIEFNKLHNLETLRKMCAQIDNDFETIEFGDLNYYGVSTRYPDGLMGMPTLKQTKELYELAKTITEYILNKI